ncbi:hypothetical protein [Streptomyces sp. Tu6071]|uniref:hypothetical protein n=1 Tax=Streptomyces sp. Tu6071 TaxID=355249 RepID=UPI00030C5C6B|nr:hypothetical protein [Streptomyces sp. Tu6071]
MSAPTPEPLTPDAALVRLRQYGERTKTWSAATYNDGTERALADIARTLSAEVTRLRAALSAAADDVVELTDEIADWSAKNAALRAELRQRLSRPADKAEKDTLRGESTPATGSAQRRAFLLDRIRSEHGQWTPGRVKRLYRRIWPAQHVLRATIRADLAQLHGDGHLTRHDAGDRRFYTLAEATTR